jgi:4-hydroxy-2-oxoheptanedioate aldolase
VRAFVEACRYPHQTLGVDPDLPSPVERLRGATVGQPRRGMLGVGWRGRGSEATAAPIWGLDTETYLDRCDAWPINPRGELLLGVKLESPEGVANCEEILDVPGLGFAELGPGDLGLSLGYVQVPRDPYPAEMMEARARVFGACRARGIAFLEGATPESVTRKIDEGVRVIAGGREETARIGRAHIASRV